MQLLILGAGGQGKVVADAAALAGEARIEFVDDRYPALTSLSRWPVVAAPDLGALRARSSRLHIAIGDGATRERLARAALALGFELVTVRHPSAVVSPFASIGAGSYLGPLACVNIDAQLGLCTIVNTSASVDHDCEIADFCHVAPGAHLAGGVHVGTRSWIGLGAAVRGGQRIGCDVMVGAGAVVVKDVADGLMVAGVPARALARSAQDHSLQEGAAR